MDATTMDKTPAPYAALSDLLDRLDVHYERHMDEFGPALVVGAEDALIYHPWYTATGEWELLHGAEIGDEFTVTTYKGSDVQAVANAVADIYRMMQTR